MVEDYDGYRNHGYRVLNFCLAMCEPGETVFRKVSVATAFHDLSIWTAHTFDYLVPSRTLANDYLESKERSVWSEEVGAMIDHHHQIRRYSDRPDSLVEPFRRADWIDVSRGLLRFGVPKRFVSDVLSTFPNHGFHKKLLSLIAQRTTSALDLFSRRIIGWSMMQTLERSLVVDALKDRRPAAGLVHHSDRLNPSSTPAEGTEHCWKRPAAPAV